MIYCYWYSGISLISNCTTSVKLTNMKNVLKFKPITQESRTGHSISSNEMVEEGYEGEKIQFNIKIGSDITYNNKLEENLTSVYHHGLHK